MDTCERCGQHVDLGDWPFCPHGRGSNSVLDDTINEINENVADQPVHFTSKAEKRRYLREHGLYEFVRHVGTPGEGSDKSPHTSRWI